MALLHLAFFLHSVATLQGQEEVSANAATLTLSVSHGIAAQAVPANAQATGQSPPRAELA